MQCCKFKELLKTFHKICYYGQTIVVPIDVHFTYECIRLVCWTNITDDFVTTKKHDCCEIESVFPCCVIFGVKPCALYKFLACRRSPQGTNTGNAIPQGSGKSLRTWQETLQRRGGGSIVELKSVKFSKNFDFFILFSV